ncbi:hypothetical protein PENTCL1PPCAC_7229, partial [Pristionchus entomophagus]
CVFGPPISQIPSRESPYHHGNQVLIKQERFLIRETTFLDLKNDSLLDIIRYLPHSDRRSIRAVNRRLHAIESVASAIARMKYDKFTFKVKTDCVNFSMRWKDYNARYISVSNSDDAWCMLQRLAKCCSFDCIELEIQQGNMDDLYRIARFFRVSRVIY